MDFDLFFSLVPTVIFKVHCGEKLMLLCPFCGGEEEKHMYVHIFPLSGASRGFATGTLQNL